jgi:hypothetical protein
MDYLLRKMLRKNPENRQKLYAGSVMNPEEYGSKWSLDYARSPCPMN